MRRIVDRLVSSVETAAVVSVLGAAVAVRGLVSVLVAMVVRFLVVAGLLLVLAYVRIAARARQLRRKVAELAP